MAENGSLTTHVLDTALGVPAAGMAVDLFRIEGGVRHLLREAVTNADGRTDVPMIGRGEMAAGVYELVFHAGDYLARQGGAAGFLVEVPVRFRVTDAGARLHVPLLVSPYGYTTYRGS